MEQNVVTSSARRKEPDQTKNYYLLELKPLVLKTKQNKKKEVTRVRPLNT
jgi:hypothetical protein